MLVVKNRMAQRFSLAVPIEYVLGLGYILRDPCARLSIQPEKFQN